MLLTNQRSTKSDNNDTYYKEPSFEDSPSISDNDNIYYEDSDDKEVKQRKEVTEKENADYTLKTGTIINFRPNTIFMNPAPVRVRIILIKDTCEIDTYPLEVEPFQLVSRTTLVKAEDKLHSFLLKDVKLEPGFIPKQMKPMQKKLTLEELEVLYQ